MGGSLLFYPHDIRVCFWWSLFLPGISGDQLSFQCNESSRYDGGHPAVTYDRNPTQYPTISHTHTEKKGVCSLQILRFRTLQSLKISTILHPLGPLGSRVRHHHILLRQPGAVGFQELHEGILLLDQTPLILPQPGDDQELSWLTSSWVVSAQRKTMKNVCFCCRNTFTYIHHTVESQQKYLIQKYLYRSPSFTLGSPRFMANNGLKKHIKT